VRTWNGQVVVLVAALLASSLAGTAARGQPVIRVEAQARLELTTRRTETGTELRVLLIDDQGAPIAGAPVTYRVASSTGELLASRTRALTESNGALEIQLGPVDERISVEARFTGDDFRSGASRVELLDTRLARTELRFIAPAHAILDLREPTVTVRLRARGEATASDVRIALSDERGTDLGAATTDDQGVAELTVEMPKLGAPGTGKLIARALGDGQRAPASAELAIVRWLPSTTTLALARSERAAVRATGTVQAAGRGIASAAVGLFTAEGAHVATLQSDEGGRFDASLDLNALGLERLRRELQLEARFESDAPWLGSSRSPPISLRLAVVQGPSPFWLAVAPLVIALALWWLGRRRSSSEASATPANAAGAGVALAHAKPRAARPRGLACTLLDARTGRPLRAASLEVVDPSGASRVVHSDARGNVRVEELEPGHYQLSFRAEGYRALNVSLEAPHRGEWFGAHVRLESLRDVALLAWAPLVAQQATKVEQANAVTLREAIQRVLAGRRANGGGAVLPALERAERAAYERAAPTDEEVQRIERDASSLLHASETRDEPGDRNGR
jgi:hypothetical protein